MRTGLIAGLACLGAAQVGAALAPAQAQSANQVVAFLDKDGDGKVSLNDYLTAQVPKFAQFDASGDGELQKSEFKESLDGSARRTADRSFSTFNSERGKGMTQREFLGYHAYVFNNYVDADGDGFMSAAEWDKLISK